ncbi:E3 ubiquitin-protein ligase RKP [Rhynchospora pubera]|uniref:RING-type E3 ubiquitin transferase n=1 Tax=Rhynchospora pubera TaxID=906938 RepID=A0AAV8APZ3_9POAL|nr:E3 ubiquitin-protein ligase RKP [Rhynchospora pubera]KAJ4793601.1 E3 ubiquitin-protein ligase RKP [Rhynchospora pubera]
MAEEGKRMSPFSSGLALLLSGDKSRGTNSQKSHLISYHDDIGHQSVERTIEHILDLHHNSIHAPSHSIDTNFIGSILKDQAKRFELAHEVNNSPRKRVSLEAKNICGRFKNIRKPLLIESVAAFSSACADACVWRGKWMFEVVLETCGVQQLGWAKLSCSFTDHRGVGDDEDSYAFDGKRVTKWNKAAKSYGQPWAIGDVIGCCIDLDKGEISFYRNGSPLGVAFDGVQVSGQGDGYGFCPAVSLSDGEKCYLNFGSHPFVYPIEGFDPLQAPPPSRRFAGYLLQSLGRLLEAEALERSDSAYFHKLRRVKRFAPLKDLFDPVSRAIFSEFFGLIGNPEGQDNYPDLEYITWGPLTSFLIEVLRSQEPHDRATLDRVLDLFLQYPESDMVFQELFMALSCNCKVAPLVLTQCPYTGSYPYLALACQILRRREMMVLWWQSHDFTVSFEGFLSGKAPNKQDLKELMPTVWWPALFEDSSTRSTMALTVRMVSEAISKIEELHRQLCGLVIRFTPPGLSSQASPGSVFRSFMQNLIVRARGMDHRTASGGNPSSNVLLSLYTVILHLLSEGIGSPSDEKLGFLHRGGSRHFPQNIFFRTDLYFSSLPRIGGSVSQLLKSHKFTGKELNEVEWEEGFMESEDFRVTHSSVNKPCCCSPSEDDWVQTPRESLRYMGGATSGTSSKASCKVIPDRPQNVVAAECSTRGLTDEIEDDKPSSSDGSGSGFSYQSLNGLGSGATVTNQSLSDGSAEALGEEELLDVMLLLYYMVVAPSFRQAFYHMSQQTQSALLLDDTDKQIREKSCPEQVKRLKEARSVYHEELVDSVRHCSWYRISLFSRWKLRGMYASCMWVVDLLLVLSDSDSVFLYVPEYYVESLVDSFHALRRSEPPFVSSAVFLKQGLSSFVTFCVKHFNDPRILSADIKDVLLQSISVLVQYRDFLVVFENNQEAVERMPRGLLSAFDNRSWIPVTNILSRLCKGCGFTSSRSTDSVSSVLFQVLLRETCIHDEELFATFLNRLFNTLSWTMTEFSMSIREMQDKHNVADLQQRKCSVIFDISCSLARLLEFCVGEIPQAFLSGPDMNLRRLTELVVFILNHIISAADTDFFDLTLRRHGEKMNRTMILAPILGIMLNILGTVGSDSESGHTSLSDVISVFCSMDCPATLHFGFQYLLNYNWSNMLRGDMATAKLAQLEELSNYFRSMSVSVEEAGHLAATEDGDDNCCICYNGESNALFEPCHHRSCFGCISRHLLNSQRCFFCNATVTSVTKV